MSDRTTLSRAVDAALAHPPGSPESQGHAEHALSRARPVADAALDGADPAARLDLHRALYSIHEVSLGPPRAAATAHEHAAWLAQLRAVIEVRWLAAELAAIQDELPADLVLRDPDRLSVWMTDQALSSRDADERVLRFFEHDATADDFRRFARIDCTLNLRFYDALVLALLPFDEEVKAELARHYWDEAGHGDPAATHTARCRATVAALGGEVPERPVWDDWRAFAGYNLYFSLGLRRRHYFRAIGSLAMPELFDPGRDAALVAGLRRTGAAPADYLYYSDHVEADAEHGSSWLAHVVSPIVRREPAAGREIAEGAVLRMVAMRRFNQYLLDTFRVRPR